MTIHSIWCPNGCKPSDVSIHQVEEGTARQEGRSYPKKHIFRCTRCGAIGVITFDMPKKQE